MKHFARRPSQRSHSRLPRSIALAATASVAVVALAACGGSSDTTTSDNSPGAATSSQPGDPSSSSSAPTQGSTGASGTTSSDAPSGAVDPNAPEVVEPGDIPDDQVFVTYKWADGSFSVDVPEGWARTNVGGAVTFTDKYNSITITSAASTAAPTVESVTSQGLADVSSDPTFHLGKVTAVSRKSGSGVLATYEIGSTPNPVTGKKALLAVERYVFAHGGHQVVLTLSGAKGADNVDPWRIVTDSLSWK